MQPPFAISAALAAALAACARPAPSPAPAPPRTFAVGASGNAALDTAVAFQLCTAPDSVLARRAPCTLKQRPAPGPEF